MDRGYYILEGTTPVPTDVMTWANWFSDPAKRKVALTNITNDVFVSTVFLGLDHRFGQQGPPILFETMSFGTNYEYQRRYSTWQEALDGHDEVVAEVRAGMRLAIWLRKK